MAGKAASPASTLRKAATAPAKGRKRNKLGTKQQSIASKTTKTQIKKVPANRSRAIHSDIDVVLIPPNLSSDDQPIKRKAFQQDLKQDDPNMALPKRRKQSYPSRVLTVSSAAATTTLPELAELNEAEECE